MAVPNREAQTKLLRESVRALSLPGREALATFDPRCCRPDELAEDFDTAFRVVVGNWGSELNVQAVSALRLLDAKLEEMSGEANAALWTEAAVLESSDWAEVRDLAGRVLRAFSWDAA